MKKRVKSIKFFQSLKESVSSWLIAQAAHMSDEDFIISHRTEEMDQPVAQKQPDFRFLVITTQQSQDGADAESEEPVQVTTENIDEFILQGLHSIDAVNDLFDAFDSEIAYPNEGHIKYEVGSDGLCVIIVDNEPLKKLVVDFVLKYGATVSSSLGQGQEDGEDQEQDDDEEEEEAEQRDSKRRK